MTVDEIRDARQALEQKIPLQGVSVPHLKNPATRGVRYYDLPPRSLTKYPRRATVRVAIELESI